MWTRETGSPIDSAVWTSTAAIGLFESAANRLDTAPTPTLRKST